jgi:fructan beta-fructosidase
VTQQTLRPEFHFTPARGWINDPNGLVYLDGEYHLFCQYHPHSTSWGPMHWLHAVSSDLLTWRELPVALEPDAHGTIFSGSAVIDHHNSAGFGHGAMVAIFTHHDDAAQPRQRQSLAYSTDRGRMWTKYDGNPVLPPPDAQMRDYRDPKVIWFDGKGNDSRGGHWVMVLAVVNEIWFYTSPDLKHWSLGSRFGAAYGSHGGVWECPDLLRMPVSGGADGETRWVLIVSVGNGAPAGGSGVQYFVGDFDGAGFSTPDAPERVRWMDYGADFYAPQSWSNAPDGRTLMIAWMNNWSYGRLTPDEGGWRGVMTLPRELQLHREAADIVLLQAPVREQDAGYANRVEHGPLSLEDGPHDLGLVRDVTLTLKLREMQTGAALGLRLTLADGGLCEIAYRPADQQLTVTRPGFNVAGAENFATTSMSPHAAPLAVLDGVLALRVIIDGNLVEVFANAGRVTLTEQVFPAVTGVALFAANCAVDVRSFRPHATFNT